jgi:plastocyanin
MDAGIYEIKAVAVDAVGNRGTETIRLEAAPRPDTEDPVVLVGHDAPATVYPGQSVEFTVTATDNVGIESLVFTVNGQEKAIGAGGLAEFTFTEVGVHEIRAVAVDAAGNVGTYVFSLEVAALPDTEKPTVGITHNGGSDITAGRTVSFDVAANDDTGVTSVSFSVNGTVVQPGQNGKYDFTFSEPGVYVISATATDAAGNVGATTITFEVGSPRDTTKPTVSISHDAAPGAKPGDSATFTVSAGDDVGVVSRALTVNGQAVALDADNKAVVTFDAAGTYTIVASAVDAAGNTGTASVVIVIVAETAEVDHERPEVSLDSDASGTLRPGATVNFAVSAADNDRVERTTLTINGVAVALDADGKAAYTFAQSGSYVVVARAVDTSGNESVATEVIKIASADVTKPTVGIVLETDPVGHTMWGENMYYTGTTVTFRVTATDSESPIASVVLYIDNREFVSQLDADGRGSIIFDSPKNYCDIVAYATDAAGNTGWALVTVGITDAPVWSGPSVDFGGFFKTDTLVKEPADIAVSASSPNGGIAEWTVTLVSNKTGESRVLGRGTGNVANEVVARLDSTGIANGAYTLVFTAVDASGYASKVERSIMVDAPCKLGNFELPFQDANITVGGMPVQVVLRAEIFSLL